MQIASTKGQESCTDVQPRFVRETNEKISVGFECSHGTLLWVHMTRAETIDFLVQLTTVYRDMNAEQEDE